MKLLALLLAMLVTSATAAPPHFVLQGVNKANVTAESLKKSDGLSIRFSQGNWQFLDSQVARSKKAGKPFMIRMMDTGKNPPWDATALKNHAEAVQVIGRKYANDTGLACVHISSTATHESAEMHTDPAVLQRKDYTVEKHIAAWTHAVNAYAAAFPNTPIVLNASIEPDSKGAVTYPVVAYCKGLGWRATFQHNSLKASTSLTAKHHQLIVDLGKQGWRIGFQMACPSSNRDRFGGTFEQAVNKATGASYLEIYQSDL